MAKKRVPEKLTKDDPLFYSKIARIAGQKLLKERGKAYFAMIGARSHPRAVYNGGRPKKATQVEDET
jgi:hypothetical protein